MQKNIFFVMLLLFSIPLINTYHIRATQFPLNATFTIDNQWPAGYQATVTLRNTTSNSSSSWQAAFTLPANQTITNIWNGVLAANGTTMVVNNPQWVGGGVISANASTTFGMIVSRPVNSPAVLNGLTAVANGTVSPPVQPPLQAPVLQAINNASGSNVFQLTWASVSGAQTYAVQQSQTSNFTTYTTPFSGAATTAQMTVAALGTYYYRVIASASGVVSAPSNTVSTTVTIIPPSIPSALIVDGYWESWSPQSPSIDAIVNMKVDVLNISFANFTSTGAHTYKIAGVESDSATIQQLVTAVHALNKKIKVAVGGATYPISPQLQTDADARGMAQAVATYVNDNLLDGVDWDIEDYPTPALQVSLLKYTRELLPTKLQTYTPKSPASTTYPYNAVITNGQQYVDYFSIMAYDYAPGYRYQDDVQALIAMGVPAGKIVVGLLPGPDDVGVTTSLDDIKTAASYIKANKLKGIMFWDLNRDYLNVTGLGNSAATNAAWMIFHS